MEREFEYINSEINSKVEVIATYKNMIRLSMVDEVLLERAEEDLKTLQSIWNVLKRQKQAA